MKKKRLLASIVTAAMLFTMVPSYALADDSTVQMINLVPATPTESTQTDVLDSTARTMSADCTAEEHQEGCPAAKPVAEEPETKTGQTPEPKSGVVAKIGETEYESLDGALANAQDGDIIEVMQDCEIQTGFAVSGQDLTIRSDGKTITANEYGIYLAKKGDDPSRLTFEGCNLVFQPKQGTPEVAGEAYPWAATVINFDCELSFKDCNVTMTSAEEGTVNTGVYHHEGSKVNLYNTDMVVSGFSTNGFSADVNDQGLPYTSELNILSDSNMEVSHNRAGVTAAMQITVKDSTFDNSWNSGNASNGADYYMTNSTVNISHNGSHGMSARNVRSINSTITCEENGGYGVTCYGTVEVDGESTIDVLKNSSKGDYAGLYLKGTSTIQSGATVSITENECSGLSNKGIAIFENGVNLTIIDNYNDKGTTSQGGGVYNFSGGSLTLPENAEIYNNHADDGADDIYSAAGCKITFGQVGSGWTLDDCGDDITGWYDDSAGNRWQGDEQQYYTKEFSDFGESGTATVTEKLALKAAHSPMLTLTYDANGGAEDNEVETYTLNEGVSSVDVEVKHNMFTREGYTFAGWADASGETYEIGSTITLASDLTLFAQWKRDVVWDGTPVGKTATPLDENYESNVTLSLPAAEYKKVIDVVFAIDCSSVLENNADKMTQALTKMAQELIQKDNIILNVGVVGFAHNADVLTALQEVNAENVDDFMSKLAKEFADSLTDDSQIDHDGGSNLQVGIRTARRLLDGSETGAMPQNRHLILMTDGAGFYYCRSETDDTSVSTVHHGDRKQCLGNMDANNDVGGNVRKKDSMYIRATKEGKTFGDFIAEQGAAIEASAVNSFSQDEAATAPAEKCYTTAQVQDFDAYPYLNMERGTYFAAQELIKAKDAGYQLTTIGYYYTAGLFYPSLGKVTTGFRDWTKTIGSYYNGSSNLDPILDSISNELGQFVDAGSQIIDEIRSGKDSQDKSYDFNFIINDVNRLKLKVGDTELTTAKVNDTTYQFGTEAEPDQFVLHYYAGGTEFNGETYGECFVLDINVPVTMEQPVTLTYAVDLTNPQSEPGTYEKLNTNNIAILYPVDSDGNPITPVEFPKPVVSYTVEESGGGGAHHPDPDPDPDPDDNDDDEEEIIDEEVPLAETPWLNTVDHYAYIVGYPEDYVTGQPTEDESRWPVKPQANISRAEVATIFFRLLTDEARDQFWMTTNNFPDVAPDAWYNNAISTMVNAGIIQGYEDGTFRPNNNITRAEFAAIASRFMSSGYDVEEDLFTDIANHWARENINDAAMTQWIHGYPDGTFLPDQAITRAEAVTLVNNVLQRKPDADHMLDSMIKWPDNPESAWYYEAIQEATNSHDYDLFEDAEYETWTALQENRDWAALEKDWVNTHRTGGEVA